MKSKDPAILFYTADFITGTLTMTNEQRGKYIMLLCLQHQKGYLTEKDMLNICGSYDEDVYCKFKKVNDKYYNERMKSEIEKRKNYSESRRKNRAGKTKDKIQNKEDMNNISKTYDSHMENENINENINENNNINNIEKNKKEKFAEFVSLEKIEYEKLVSEHGKENADNFIRILDNYKGANGKKYKSDYRAILNWVVDKTKKEGTYIKNYYERLG